MYLISVENYLNEVIYNPTIVREGVYKKEKEGCLEGEYFICVEALLVANDIDVTKCESSEWTEVQVSDLKGELKNKCYETATKLLSGFRDYAREHISTIDTYKKIGYNNLNELIVEEKLLKEKAKKIGYTIPYIR